MQGRYIATQTSEFLGMFHDGFSQYTSIMKHSIQPYLNLKLLHT